VGPRGVERGPFFSLGRLFLWGKDPGGGVIQRPIIPWKSKLIGRGGVTFLDFLLSSHYGLFREGLGNPVQVGGGGEAGIWTPWFWLGGVESNHKPFGTFFRGGVEGPLMGDGEGAEASPELQNHKSPGSKWGTVSFGTFFPGPGW